MGLVHCALTLLFGLLVVLGTLRSIEGLTSGEGVMVVQVAFSLGGLILARTCLIQARRSGTRPTGQGTT